MDKITAQQLLLVHKKLSEAKDLLIGREKTITSQEVSTAPYAWCDFLYFGQRLQSLLDDMEHRIEEAKEEL